MSLVRIALAQINATVGDLANNAEKIKANLNQAREVGADIVLFPELALTGYPPEDLLFKRDFLKAQRERLDELVAETEGITAVIGFVDFREDIYNAAAICHNGQLVGIYHKKLLPNYAVFDEDRYFASGDTPLLFSLPHIGSERGTLGAQFGVTVCEDVWYPEGPATAQAAAGAELLLNISASPYRSGKIQSRESMLQTRATDNVAIVAFCNLVGGQDELVFDGSSCIIDQNGKILARASSFAEEFIYADVNIGNIFHSRLRDPRRRKNNLMHTHPDMQTTSLNQVVFQEHTPHKPTITPFRHPHEEIWEALVMGTRDYLHKNGFKTVILGLSGGIDSTIVAAIAADALGGQNVTGVSMPSRYSSDHSKSDAQQLAENLGIVFKTIPIETAHNAYLDMLANEFADTQSSVAEENIQARIRGNILMAISNKFGPIVLTTGNKSEMAVGYATLYGDMAGGYAVIKDVYKQLVYDLCRWRNEARGHVIPDNVITKPPSAELRPDQFDSDSLPDYDILDAILEAYIEEEKDAETIIALGYKEADVKRVLTLVNRAEYKRRQAPPGPRVTSRAFGKDRRLPITNRFK